MQAFNVPAGAQMLLGAPAQPMAKSTSDAIAQLVANMEGVAEAHLPQCFVGGVMEKPAQILVVVTTPRSSAATILRDIGDGLRAILPDGEFLDVWPVQSGNAMLNDVRGTGCEIYNSATDTNDTEDRKPWWKFW